jgi:hypothetical protein
MKRKLGNCAPNFYRESSKIYMLLVKGRQQVVIENLQLLEPLELGDGEGDVSIQQVERQIPSRTGTSRAQLKTG